MSTTPITDVASLRAAIGAGLSPRYLFFWGHTAKGASLGPHVLSQWWPAAFSIDGQTYPTAEHYMMAEKARLFGDEAARAAILASDNPGKVKAIGRTIAAFDESTWAAHRFDIVVAANSAKFGQNAALKAYLLETGTKVLVEGSPVDAIWGIGLAADDPRAQDPSAWEGLNLLGFALMKARTALASQHSG